VTIQPRHRRLPRRLAAVAAVTAITLAACGGDDDSAGQPADETTADDTTADTTAETTADDSGSSDLPSGPDKFTYFGQTQNTTIIGTLESMAGDECATEEAAAPLTSDSTDGTQWDQQLQLLAGQDALSNMGMAAGTPALMQEFIDNGLVLNLSDELERMGLTDEVLPAATATLKSLYNSDDLWALPTEYNIEGFWYNASILEEQSIEPPATWADLVAAAEALDAAGVQPFVAAGSDGWPVTRLVGNYIFRSIGPDALQAVADGEASLTDPEYVAAADAVAALGEAGYFGPAPGSIDYATAMNQFLTGGGAFFYMGSWALANFNNPDENQIGVDNIGYLPFPAVDGGAGSIDQVPANAGIPVMFSSNNYGQTTADWLACIVQNYGEVALADFGQVTGLKIDESPADVSALTQVVQDVIADASGSVLWFEAKFSPEGTTVSQTNGGGLASGSLSGQEFMELVQAGNDG
jgi:raffinose/stachyose/melibiose transport system substrate-binding protein